MDYLAAKLALSGDARQTVVYSKFNWVSLPEIEILQVLHGKGSVTEVKHVGGDDEDETPEAIQEELTRLRSKYGQVVDHLFPGVRPNVQLLWPDAPKEKKVVGKQRGPRKTKKVIDPEEMANAEAPVTDIDDLEQTEAS